VIFLCGQVEQGLERGHGSLAAFPQGKAAAMQQRTCGGRTLIISKGRECMLRPYIGLFFILGVSGLAEARPVDLDAPSGTLGSSDAMGFVEAWEEVQDVDFGGGLTLPLRFGFSSNPNRSSSIFGNGWVVPLLDSNATLIDETSMRVELL